MRTINQLRTGFVSTVPTVTYRVTPGPVGIEVSAGSNGFVTIGRAGVTAEF